MCGDIASGAVKTAGWADRCSGGRWHGHVAGWAGQCGNTGVSFATALRCHERLLGPRLAESHCTIQRTQGQPTLLIMIKASAVSISANSDGLELSPD